MKTSSLVASSLPSSLWRLFAVQRPTPSRSTWSPSATPATRRIQATAPPAGVGSVPYNYRIGKCEATAGQYAEFLNAVAKDDPNELYNEFMDVNLSPDFAGANFPRSGSSGNYQLQRRSPLGEPAGELCEL
jgi:hypothetical protein